MSAPSFSSFPPSFTSFPEIEAVPTAYPKSSSKPKKEEKKRKRHRDQREADHHSTSAGRESRRDKDRHRHKSRSEKDRSLKSQEPAVKGDEYEKPNLLFYSDRKGDMMNIQYGGLHTGDVPKYRMVSGGRNVLGLPKALVVLRRVGKGVEVGLNYQRKTANLSTAASRALLAKPPSRRLIPSTRTDRYEEVDGFIGFPSRTTSCGADPSYRSITENDHEHSDSSLSSSEGEDNPSSDEDSDTPTLTAHQETLQTLQQEVEARPDAVDKWMSLLNQTLSTIPITSKNATKARSEIAVSILSRAISASPRNSKSRSLRLAYLRAGEEIWHESKLRSEWEDALKVEDIEIQIEWLEWKIRRGNRGVDGVIEASTRVMDKIGGNAEVEKVRVFWRVAMCIKSAGYSERASAMFQAQAELTFNSPPELTKMSFQAQLSELEKFWESECPRIGEHGAQGWYSWYSLKQDLETNPGLPSIRQRNSDLDPYRQWASQEMQMDNAIFLPLRSDADSSDPYSTVLFTDFRATLLELKSLDAKRAFRMAWLSFLGLSLPGFSLSTSDGGDWDDRWNLNYLTTPRSLDSIFPSDTEQNNLSTDAVAGVIIGREREYNSPFGPVRCWNRNVSGPLDLTSAEPGKVVKRGIWSKGDLSHLDEDFVRRLFLGLKISNDDLEWDALALAFDLAVNPKTAIKLSKSLLSTNQDSLGLWGAHAQLERLRGRIDDARKIYQTILIASKPERMKRDVGLLWWNWAEMEWLSGNDQQALNVVLQAVGIVGPLSGVTVLRAKRSLEEVADATRVSNGWKEQENWVKLRALLELLGGYEPEDAFSIFDKYLSTELDKTCSESLITASLVMIYCYGTVLKKPMQPAILRERAHRAFEQYPNNSIILGILLAAEKGQGVWGRVRSMLGGTDGKAKDVARRTEEIWIAGWERGRWPGEVERTRNGLAAAVEHERTRFSAVIWRIYIEFEIRVHELQRAKRLLFRAIGECPLVKELYLLAFGPLRSVFQKHELNGLADTMAERGIRLRQGLDEAVGGMEDTEDSGAEVEREGSEDEIEHNASELRRLMPY